MFSRASEAQRGGVEKVVGHPPLVEMDDRQRREFHEALLDVCDVMRRGRAGSRKPNERRNVSEEREQEGQPESAEDEEASKLSKKTPDEASGEDETPLGSTDQHSDAPGPHGTG
jgi:hypothetical protein